MRLESQFSRMNCQTFSTGSPANRWLEDRNLAPSTWFRPEDIYKTALEEMGRRQQMERLTTPYNPNTPGVDRYFDQSPGMAKPEVDMSSADAALQRAGTIGGDIVNALSVSARLHVNTATLERALSLANQLKAALSGIGPAVQPAHSSVSCAMNRNFTDQGVVP